MKTVGKCRNCERQGYVPAIWFNAPPVNWIFCSGCWKPCWVCDCEDSKGDRDPACVLWWATVRRRYLRGVTYDR